MAAALAAGTLPVSSSSGRSDSANDAYARALTNALAEGRSLSEAASLAQQAASAQAAADAASGDPNAALASGTNVLAALGAEASSSLYQQALGAELARGSTLAQAQAAARAAEAGLSETNNDPATMMATALATGRIGNLMNNMSGPASSAFERTLSGALARGASVAEALAQARDAATQADGLDGASRGNALAELAADAKRTGGGNEGPAYDRALSSALAAGLPLDLAQTRAREAARIMAAATGERMTEADALASGRRLDEVLGERAKNPTFMTAFNRALAAGKDVRSAIAEADRAARQAANAEQGQDRLREALATGRQVDPAKVPHSGDLVGPAKALFDRVLGRVLQTGAPLAEAVAKANDAVAEFQATEDAAARVPPPPPIPLRAQAGR